MTSKHTPGPWISVPNVGNGEYNHTYHIGSACESGPDRIAKQSAVASDSDFSVSADECEANARLIASAPELLAAAKYAIDNLDAAAKEGIVAAPRWFQCQLLESSKMLRAAIAKAEGVGDES